MSCGEHAAAQEALQLKRQKLELHVAGQAWQQPSRALPVDPHRSIDELAREQKFVQADWCEWDSPMGNKAFDFAEVVIEIFTERRMRSRAQKPQNGTFLYWMNGA